MTTINSRYIQIQHGVENEILRIPIRENNQVYLSTINQIVPNASLLKYKKDNVCVDFINGYLCPAEGDAWHGDLIYVPILPDSSVSSQQSATSSQRSKMFTVDKVNLAMIFMSGLITTILTNMFDMIKVFWPDSNSWQA
ncbi:unnamed protein product [Rotaria magnacalcarata]|uniref:TAR DNA-binding protein 43 N-terminal domain-containing protein n=1 Tax=Rotaria magnacalcarata TaxID=392030 RepID=A0A816VSM9_9BILA|nr:unnamed protein product [Rotaria magnacalcarata]